MAALVLCAVAAASPVAHAQDETPDGPNANDVALAREQFRIGLTASEAGHWEDARVAFARSFQLAPRPITLLNLAGAQAQTAHYVEAAESYRRFRQEATGHAVREIPGAEEALAAVEQRIAHVQVQVTHLAPHDVVSVDGREVSHVALGVDMPVDPGDHTVTVTRQGETIGTATLHADEGERIAEPVRIEVPPAPLDVEGIGDDGGPRRHGRGEDLLASPIFWGVAGGAAAVVVIIIIIAVVASAPPGPYVGNIPPGTLGVM